ncbi:TPA: hypothetical protein HMU85_25435 [Escherichia coli]|nr:hypothetical protein [Escherichia coli]
MVYPEPDRVLWISGMPREVTFQTGGGLVNYPRLLSSMDNPFSQTCQQPAFMFFYLREFICTLCRDISVIQKSGRNKL